MVELENYAKELEHLKKEVEEVFASMKNEYTEPKTNEKITLVFAGQYSSGKSSIISMLTGNKNIRIGEGITTQKVEKYDWNGIEVFDTPGIHTELRKDHDELSYQAIASADLLVYVISNELFDSNLGKRFRTVAIDKHKAQKIILVVNKMTNTGEGNTPEQQDVIKQANGFKNVIEPYTAEDLYTCFLDAKSYLDSLQEVDAEIANELRKRSGYDEFIGKLNKFVKDKEVLSKLTTPIYQLDLELDKAKEKIKLNFNDSDIEALRENYRQQKYILTEARSDLKNEIVSMFSIAGTKITQLGLDAANEISGCSKASDMEEKLYEKIKEAQTVSELCQKNVQEIIIKRMSELGREIDKLENSEFSMELKNNLVKKIDKLPDNLKKTLNESGAILKNAGNFVTKNSYNATANGGIKLSNFSSSNTHNFVLDAGHFVGHKFKPWEAIKITKGIAVAGQVLSIVGVVVTVGMQMREDSKNEEVRKALEENRIKVRSQFNNFANELESYGRNFIANHEVVKNLELEIEKMNENIKEIDSTIEIKNEYYKKLTELQDACYVLIKKINQN